MLKAIEVLRWFQMLANVAPRELEASEFWSLFEQRPGEPLHAPPVQLAQPASLLVVVTTYRRPAACERLLSCLHDALQSTPLRACVLVLNDRSDADYGAVREHAAAWFGDALCWLDARERLGKPGFWRTYQVSFLAAQALAPDYALYLQDDCEFAPDLVSRALALWRATEHDVRRRVLYLFSSGEDEEFGRWVVHRRRRVDAQLSRTQWFDLQAFFVDRRFFEQLEYRLIPVHPHRWRRRPAISSGVGQQLTLRLFLRANIYQTTPALVLHGAHPSEMNPDARARRALDNRGSGQA